MMIEWIVSYIGVGWTMILEVLLLWSVLFAGAKLFKP